MTLDLKKYQKLLELDEGAQFIKIDHADAMVADVYKIERRNKLPLILKICERLNDYTSEVYFLKYFSKQIPVPSIINTLSPNKENYGAILMECLPGNLLIPELITKEIAFELGKSLAIIHNNKADGFGYLNREVELLSDPMFHFKEKFQEGIDECKNHLPVDLIAECCGYFNASLSLLEKADGPCVIHRDFRPGNIIVENNKLRGIIDWSSARASFAEDDFCSIEHGEWGDFNGYKNYFLEGYSSIRTVPDYHQVIPLLRLNRAIAVIGFTVKRGTWNTANTRPYQLNRNFIDNFFRIKNECF